MFLLFDSWCVSQFGFSTCSALFALFCFSALFTHVWTFRVSPRLSICFLVFIQKTRLGVGLASPRAGLGVDLARPGANQRCTRPIPVMCYDLGHSRNRAERNHGYFCLRNPCWQLTSWFRQHQKWTRHAFGPVVRVWEPMSTFAEFEAMSGFIQAAKNYPKHRCLWLGCVFESGELTSGAVSVMFGQT